MLTRNASARLFFLIVAMGMPVTTAAAQTGAPTVADFHAMTAQQKGAFLRELRNTEIQKMIDADKARETSCMLDRFERKEGNPPEALRFLLGVFDMARQDGQEAFDAGTLGRNAMGILFRECEKVAQDELAEHRRAAEQGNAESQTFVGVAYKNGWGVQADDAESVRWFRRAAAQRHAKGQSELGEMYDHARGVRQDYDEAARLYRLAAEQGDARAQFLLGRLYANGNGVPADRVQVFAWWSLAAAQGDTNAERSMPGLRQMLSRAEIAWVATASAAHLGP